MPARGYGPRCSIGRCFIYCISPQLVVSWYEFSSNVISLLRQRGVYQSIINVIYGLAAASGAAFGGALADTLGWRWEFGIQVVPLLMCLAVAFLSMPADLGLQSGREKQTLLQALRGFDFAGSALLTASTTFLILGLVSGCLSLTCYLAL